MKHYLKNAEDVIKSANSDINGLSSSEASKRLAQTAKTN